jgi:hypothetical protein
MLNLEIITISNPQHPEKKDPHNPVCMVPFFNENSPIQWDGFVLVLSYDFYHRIDFTRIVPLQPAKGTLQRQQMNSVICLGYRLSMWTKMTEGSILLQKRRDGKQCCLDYAKLALSVSHSQLLIVVPRLTVIVRLGSKRKQWLAYLKFSPVVSILFISYSSFSQRTPRA